jgi:UDP-N-acetylglucosamine acyltransferase
MPVHPSAVIDPCADIDSTAVIGPNVIVDGPVHIGPGCRIGPSVVLLGRTEIGAGCRIHPFAVIGDVPQDRAYDGGQSGCRVGTDCVIREGTTIHRGTNADSETVVGSRCLLMTNCHVGHNCTIDDDVTLVSGVLLGGYVRIGAKAVLSGNAAVHQFVRIGELAMVSALAKIVQDVPPFLTSDRNGAIVSVNAVGLRRAGLSPHECTEIKAAYRLVYRSGVGRREAIERLTDCVTTDAGRRFLDFLMAPTQRGIRSPIARTRRTSTKASPDSSRPA